MPREFWGQSIRSERALWWPWGGSLSLNLNLSLSGWGWDGGQCLADPLRETLRVQGRLTRQAGHWGEAPRTEE